MTDERCGVCGIRHNLWMDCRTARRLLDQRDGRCPDCDHQHAGPALGGICIGCPCERVQ